MNRTKDPTYPKYKDHSISALIIAMNLLVDVLYGLIDPQVRYE